jgi:ketosteroid isomerase-like protein
MSNADLFRRHLANVGRPASEQDLDVYAEGFVAEFPYAPEGHTRRLEGREAISRFLAAIGTFAEGFRLGEPRIVEAGDDLIAEYHGDSTFKETGRPYAQDYVAVARVEGGRIAHLREYYDPLRVLRAMGEID